MFSTRACRSLSSIHTTGACVHGRAALCSFSRNCDDTLHACPSCRRIKLEIPADQADLSPDDVKLCWTIAAHDTCETMGWVRRTEPRRVWDAFPFFNEFRVLKLRLHTLAPVVHRFVLAEATRTFSNAPKPLHFGERVRADAELAGFAPQIEHVIVDDMPTASDWPFDRELHQRNALVRGRISRYVIYVYVYI